MNRGVTLVLNCLRSGGAEKQLLWIAAEIRRQGIECSIFELVSGERTERIESMVRAAVSQGVTVLRAPARSGLLGGAWRLYWYLHKCRASLVWSWGLRADCTVLLARIGGCSGKWLISIRSARKRMLSQEMWAQWVVAKYSDGIVANTRAGIELSGIGRLQGAQTRIMPNAVLMEMSEERALPFAPPERLVLVMLGNIKLQTKGYDLAIRLARKLRDNGVQFELRIAGRPDELEELDALIAELAVESFVKFYGEVSCPEEFLREGHLYLLLSRFEGMPNTLLEALNCGLPAIATEVGDLRELKDAGAPYFLIPIENVDAAVTAVKEAIANWTETRAIAAKGRKWVQEIFSETACRVKLRSILAEVIGL